MFWSTTKVDDYHGPFVVKLSVGQKMWFHIWSIQYFSLNYTVCIILMFGPRMNYLLLLCKQSFLSFTGTGVGGRINTRLRLSLTDPLKETLLRILFCLPDGWDGAISSVPKNWWCTELVHLIRRSYSNGYTNIHIYLYIPVHVLAYIFFLITPGCTTQLVTRYWVSWCLFQL